MRPHLLASTGVLAVSAVILLGCSASGSDSSLVVGNDGMGGAGNQGAGGSSIVIVGDAGRNQPLSAHIEQGHMRVAVITVSCAGDCADVVAVATGGNAPYSFAWEDGSTSATRRVCPTGSTSYSVTVKDAGVASGEFKRDPDVVEVALTADVLNCPPPTPDSGSSVPPIVDAGPLGPCVLGDPLGGTVTYFGDGMTFPAGRYRVTYVDGCMKYGSPVGWSIHNVFPISWNLIAAGVPAGVLPGTVSYHDTFDACVADSLLSPPIEVQFNGGQLGVQLSDYPLTDNVAGENGRDPKWCLTPL